MPLRDTEAVILRTYSLGEADRLVSFYSRQLGRMRGVAPGAKRTKTKFGSALEPLSYVRIWFAEKETRDLVRIRQCEVIESSLAAHGDYSCSLALSMLSEITENVQPEREPSDRVFRLLLLAVREVEARKEPELALLYFCFWSVRLAGWLPEFSACGKCRRVFGGGAAGYASPIHPVLLCGTCKLPGMRALSSQSIEFARRMLQAKLEDLRTQEWPSGKGRDLLAFLLDMVEHQIERKLKTRALLESNR